MTTDRFIIYGLSSSIHTKKVEKGKKLWKTLYYSMFVEIKTDLNNLAWGGVDPL